MAESKKKTAAERVKESADRIEAARRSEVKKMRTIIDGELKKHLGVPVALADDSALGNAYAFEWLLEAISEKKDAEKSSVSESETEVSTPDPAAEKTSSTPDSEVSDEVKSTSSSSDSEVPDDVESTPSSSDSEGSDEVEPTPSYEQNPSSGFGH